jgi:hypothetical protein
MTHPITYFAIIGRGTTVEHPLGLLRRLQHDVGFSDEALQRDMSWAFTPLIVEYEHDSYGRELVEVSHAQADQIIQYFRQKRATDDQAAST